MGLHAIGRMVGLLLVGPVPRLKAARASASEEEIPCVGARESLLGDGDDGLSGRPCSPLPHGASCGGLRKEQTGGGVDE